MASATPPTYRSMLVAKERFVVLFSAVAIASIASLWGGPVETKVLVAPWYLLVLPGGALLLGVRKDVDGLVEFLLKSFILSVLLTFGLRTGFWILRLPLQLFVWVVAAWILGFLLLSLFRGRRSGWEGASIRFTKTEAVVSSLSVLAFGGVALVAINSPYTPTPDELKYLLDARSLNLFSSFTFVTTSKVGVLNFVVSRPVWSVTIASFLAASSAPMLTSRVIEILFVAIMMLAAFKLTSLLTSEGAGIAAAAMAFSVPILFVWGTMILLDFAFATFCFLGYLFFVKSVRFGKEEPVRIATPWLALAAVSFLLAFLTKPGNLIVLAIAYLGFGYAVWRSEVRWRKQVFLLVVSLPLAYLGIDLMYNLSTYVLPDRAVHNLLQPILPVSFFERIFTLFHPSSAFTAQVSIYDLTPLRVAQGLYVALISPYLLTYPIVFLLLAGIVATVRKSEGTGKFNLVMSLLIILVGSLLSSLLLYVPYIPRNAVFIYPFVVCLAAVGLYSIMGRRTAIWLSVCLLVPVAAYLIEQTMIGHGGITVGTQPGANITHLSVYTVGLTVGLELLLWKTVQSTRIQKMIIERPRLARPYRSAELVAVGFIAILALSQTTSLVATSPVFAESSFGPFQAWLNSSIRDGDIIATNGNQTVIRLANDSLLGLIHEGSVKVELAPPTQPELIQWSLGSSYKYLVIFKNPQYTFTDSYASGNYSYLAQATVYVMRSPLVDVYRPIY
ncbi:MAG: glycosyltransferase family 39 protein [Thaumarchaeota archaeon]|nr:glycosyltransferase family 39 protein [Nitrososphaerota archaeon]